MTLFLIIFLSFGKFVFVFMALALITRLNLDNRYPAFEGRPDRTQMLAELRDSWTIPLDGIVFGGAVYFEIFVAAPNSLYNSAITFLFLFIFFEFWFYFTHRFMHWPRLRPVHVAHHRSRKVDPLSGLRFSIGEKTVLTIGSTGLAILASQILPITEVGILVFFVVYYAFSTIGHSNVDPIWNTRTGRWIGKVFATPRFHAEHHRNANINFSLSLSILDRCFGTDCDAVKKKNSR